ncbi:MalM family protein [Vibrio sp.]|nr:MalM family protein [Vibrio sp.]
MNTRLLSPLTLSLLLGVVSLSGCQTTSNTDSQKNDKLTSQQEAVNVQTLEATAVSFSELTSYELVIPSDVMVSVTPESQRLQSGAIDSAVVVFDIPANRGPLRLSIVSHIKESVFVPSAIIVGSDDEIYEVYEDTSFEYRKPRLHLDNRLVLETDFYPPELEDTVRLIIFTTDEAQQHSTPVIHPARLDAEGRGNYLPEAKDIDIPNSEVGSIEVSVTGIVQLDKPIEENNSTSLMQKQVVTKKAQPETEAFFNQSIKEAVEEGDISKALALLEEAKALNIESAEAAFIEAVNKK